MTFKVAAAGGTPPAWRRWAVPGLIGSLMLNVALVGAFAGSALVSHRHPGGHGMAPPVERGLVAFVRSLPSDRAKTLLMPFESARPELRAQRKEVKDRRREAFEAFTADKLDGEALKAALQRATEAESKLQSSISGVFVETASKLSPAERLAYRNWRERQDGPADHHPAEPKR